MAKTPKNKNPETQLSFLDLMTTSAASPVRPAESAKATTTTINKQKTYTAPPTPSVARAIPDYRLPEEGRKLSKTWVQKALDNITAIRISKEISEENRPATADEQEKLAKFIAFSPSALSQKVFPAPGSKPDEKWAPVIEALEAAATEKEIESLARSTQYAHFTPEPVIQAIWSFITESLGFEGGRILEPGCGPGLFIALLPENLIGKAKFTGVELDPITARISTALYPNQNIVHADFTEWTPKGTYDLAIGNPPFSSRTIAATKEMGGGRFSLHAYFIAKAMTALKEGSYGVFICSRYLMDSNTETQRENISKTCSFIGAVRLPAGGLKLGNDTEVVSDILIFRKGHFAEKKDWIETESAGIVSEMADQNPNIDKINTWFVKNPHMVLGTGIIGSSSFGPRYNCIDTGKILPSPETGTAPFRKAILNALQSIVSPATNEETHAKSHPQDNAEKISSESLSAAQPDSSSTDMDDILQEISKIEDDADESKNSHADADQVIENLKESISHRVGSAATGSLLKENSYLIIENILHQIVDHYPVKTAIAAEDGHGLNKKQEKIIRSIIPIRDLVREIIRIQATLPENADPSLWSEKQKKLKDLWQTFVAKFGPINHEKSSSRINQRTGKEIITVRRPNISAFIDDPDAHLVASIENYDPDTDIAKPGPIFSERILFPEKKPKIENSHDALAVLLNSKGRFDLNETAALANKTRDEVIKELGEIIYPDIFDETSQDWVLAEEILSGNVREKTEIAKKRAKENPLYEKVAEKLEETIPADLAPSDITLRPGATWIPSEIIESFCKEILNVKTTITYDSLTDIWVVAKHSFMHNAEARTKWGTSRRHAGQIMEDVLNSHVPEIYDYHYEDGRKVRTLNQEATEAAKDCIQKIITAFSQWVWQDTDRSNKLLGIYNVLFNSIVPRKFDGSHLTFPGQSTAITLRPLQRNAVWRIVATGNTYLYHCVGSGKTYTIASAVMEQQRLGLVSKPVIVVPNHCLNQFATDFMRLYPQANILVADETNFSKEKRQRFVARMTLNRQDAILISHDAFKLIPAPAAYEEKMAQDEADKIYAILEKSESTGFSRKALEAKKEAIEAQIKQLQERSKDNMLCFSETGIDQIIADEAHTYRKLSFATRQTTLKGVDPNGSQRAWDLYVKLKYLDDTNASKRSKILATGTAITNTIGELYSVFRMMDEDTLIRQKTESFDAWLATYGESRTELELQPSGLYKPVTRLTEFVNIADLMSSFRHFADIIQKHDLATQVSLPKIKSGQRQILVSKPSENFKEYKESLARRIRIIENTKKKPQKGDDIILSVINDGRHAAIDLRLVGFGYNEPENKLNEMIYRTFEIWKNNRENVYKNPKTGENYARTGAAQMIFSDLGTEKVAEKRGFSAYVWIKTELVRLGIPAEEITFMQDYKTSSARNRIFSAVNEGRISVLIGSTQTMGTGANAQQRLIALHHLDVPWLVSDLVQREGRIERQGNQNETVEIYAYATRGSVDATSWQRLEQKARFINMAFSGDRSVRRISDVGDDTTQFAQAKALASGDPKLMRKGTIENEIARLRRLAAAHIDRQHLIKNRIMTSRERIEQTQKKIKTLKNMRETVEERDPDIIFTATSGRSYGSDEESVTDACKYIEAFIEQEAFKPLGGTRRNKTIGQWMGLPLMCSTYSHWNDRTSQDCDVYLQVDDVEIETSISVKSTPGRIKQALKNAAEMIPEFISSNTRKLEEAEETFSQYSAIPLEERFPNQQELDDLKKELREIEFELEKESKEKDEKAKKEDKEKELENSKKAVQTA